MIRVSHLSKNYGPRSAISDLTFEVQSGEVIGFLGPNGAGKSTTMKILSGFMPASSGTATVAGFDVFTQAYEVKKHVGYLPETPPVYTEMQVEDYLLFAAALKDVEAPKRRAAVHSVIEKTGLAPVSRRLIGNLSKGYRQRVGLAQALVHDPKVLILDEPTVGLDPKQIIEIRQVIRNLAGAHTVILSSHILPEVTATCQRVIVINQGRIVAQDTIERLSGSLAGQQTYHLVARKATGPAIQALKAVSGVKSITQDGNRLDIELSSGSDEVREKLVEAAVQSGIGVLEFSPSRLSLEDVFVKLTTTEAGL